MASLGPFPEHNVAQSIRGGGHFLVTFFCSFRMRRQDRQEPADNNRGKPVRSQTKGRDARKAERPEIPCKAGRSDRPWMGKKDVHVHPAGDRVRHITGI